MLRRKIRRLIDLHQLLWAKDRITSLETRLGELKARVSVVEQPPKHISREEFDALKSSIDVPPELINDFFEWKMRTPVPEHPLISVTVTTYNRARLLTERCIPSILNQTYDNLELIVVGDCCTDETEQAVAQINDPRLRFYNLPERGHYPADPMQRWMVAGMYAGSQAYSMIRGDFITHLDDDDEHTPDRLEKLLKFATENACDMVWHPFWYENENGEWFVNEANRFAFGQVTNSSVLYRSWFTRIKTDPNSYRLEEPGDWNRFRRIKYINPVLMRYPEPLLRHYRERTQVDRSSIVQ